MHYGITTEATDMTEEMLSNWKVRLWKAILFFVPLANPDNEKLYPSVRAWALELDEEGWPKREVGLGARGEPLFSAPNERNTGFWPDMAIRQFETCELEPLSAEQFEGLWKATQAVV